MRFLNLFLLGILLVSGATAQTVISGVRASGREVRPGGIFDPDASITIDLDEARLRKALGLPANDAAVAGDLNALKTLTEASKSGLAALREVERTGDQLSIDKVSEAFNAIGGLFRQYGRADRLDRELKAVAPGAGYVLRLTSVYFEEAAQLADEIRIRLRKDVPKVRVRLALARDRDLSRGAEASFGILPGEESRTALSGFLAALELPGDPGAVTPDSLKNALVTRLRGNVETSYAALRPKVDTLAESYSKRIDEVIANSTGAAKTEWESIRTELDAVNVQWSGIKRGVQALTAAPSGSTADLPLFVSRANGLATDVNLLIAGLRAIRTRMDAAIPRLAGNAKGEATALRTLVREAFLAGEGLFKEAFGAAKDGLALAADLFNLVDKLEAIGETVRDAEGGTVTFKNSDGRLGDLPPIRSYDRLRIEVYDKPDDPANAKSLGDPYDVHAWRSNRLDNITALGFYTKSDSQWAGAPILGQAFKLTARNATFRTNRYLLPGFGYSVMALDQDGDGQTEIGVGAMLTLLDDKLVGGYGYNTSGGGGYWYAGFRFRL